LALNILIAEDNDFTALQYNMILEKQGHKVIITKDGEECLQRYKDEKKKNEYKMLGEGPFDVVVLDQSMPKKTGREVANEILKTTPNQRIIFASAYALGSENETSEDFKENVEFLQKPFSLTKLVRQLGN
jgi:two-component system, cell cycle response regulator CpdR